MQERREKGKSDFFRIFISPIRIRKLNETGLRQSRSRYLRAGNRTFYQEYKFEPHTQYCGEGTQPGVYNLFGADRCDGRIC